MKARGTVWAGLVSLLFAAGFGIFLVMTLTGVWTQKGQSAVAGVVLCGIVALAAFGMSRIEDDAKMLNDREREAREAYERKLADIERRRKALP